jgi:formylglycine-generating enzyme required for sulfatase activity
MQAGFVLAIMLCSGDNCDMVQAEPGVAYPTYEMCATASTSKSAMLNNLTAQYRSERREADIICLRELRQITAIATPYETVDATELRAEPDANAQVVGSLAPGQRVVASGTVVGTSWLRVVLPSGTTGFVEQSHLRTPAAPVMPPPRAGPVAQPSVPQTSTAIPPHAGEFRDCADCPVMLPLPAGVFIMGSNEDPTERPAHRVSIPPTALGKFMVTEAEWDACAAAGSCAYKPRHEADAAGRRPMTNLSQADAAQYLGWLRKVTGKPYRLPSEAEWEYAARAGSATRFGFGDQVGTGRVNCDGCGGSYDPHRPANVDAFPPNALGLYGMLGGVAEWVEDCWHPSYQGAPNDGAAWATGSCERRVLRGGSWKSSPSDVTVSARNFYDASVRYVANGVRVALPMR